MVSFNSPGPLARCTNGHDPLNCMLHSLSFSLVRSISLDGPNCSESLARLAGMTSSWLIRSFDCISGWKAGNLVPVLHCVFLDSIGAIALLSTSPAFSITGSCLSPCSPGSREPIIKPTSSQSCVFSLSFPRAPDVRHRGSSGSGWKALWRRTGDLLPNRLAAARARSWL